MKEKILEVVLNYLQSISQTALFQQALYWELTRIYIFLGIGLILLFAALICLALIVFEKMYDSEICWIILFFSGLLGSVVTIFCIHRIYLFYYAPQLFLIEFAKTLL